MTMLQMYIFTRIDYIRDGLGSLGEWFFVVFLLATTVVVLSHIEPDAFTDTVAKIARVSLFAAVPLMVFFWFAYVLMPSQKDLAGMVIVPNVLTTENVEELKRVSSEGIDFMKLIERKTDRPQVSTTQASK